MQVSPVETGRSNRTLRRPVATPLRPSPFSLRPSPVAKPPSETLTREDDESTSGGSENWERWA